MITWENYEEYIMMYADGELNPAEELALMAFVNEHPELKKELAAYELTRMTPDNTQIYADKDALLKPLPAKRTVALPVWVKYSIAAGIAAIIFASLFEYRASDSNIPEVAKTNTANRQTVTAPGTPVVAAAQDIKPQISHQDTAVKDQSVQTTAAVTSTSAANKKAAAPGKNFKDADKVDVASASSMDVLPLAVAKQIIADKDTALVSASKEIPAYAVQNAGEEQKRTFWDKLPINDISKQHLEDIAGAVAGAYEQVSDIKQNIEERKLTIRVEKRKLMISF